MTLSLTKTLMKVMINENLEINFGILTFSNSVFFQLIDKNKQNTNFVNLHHSDNFKCRAKSGH